MGTKKYWVSMTDKMLSGWGMAEGRISKYIVECETLEQAQTIERNAQKRPEMRHINICESMPRYSGKKYRVDRTNYEDLGPIWKK